MVSLWMPFLSAFPMKARHEPPTLVFANSRFRVFRLR